MKISVFGLGYVGCVSGACLAKDGHIVIGVDVNPIKVDMINKGKSPIVEKDINEIIEDTVKSGNLSARADWKNAVKETDVALVCVATPSSSNGNIDLKYIKRVCEHIGEGLKDKQRYFVVVIRSTVLPGTIENEVIPVLERASGKKVGNDFGVCMNPEFMREGSSVYDFYNPAKIVIGEYDKRTGNVAEEMYKGIDAPVIRTDIKVAEMIKYADNTFHALKVTFANEIGNICKKLDIDSHKLMDIFCMDTKLNLSPCYLKPGFSFGGSCLPKDLRAITYKAKTLDIDTPVLNNVLTSNRKQVQMVINKLLEYKGKRLGFLGLSFKGGTDDLRESPMVELIETMLGKGFKVLIYDKYVSLSRLMGANKEYIEKEIPHISSLMCSSLKELLKKADIIIIGNKEVEFKRAIKELRNNQVIIDLVRMVEDKAQIKKGTYYGLCW